MSFEYEKFEFIENLNDYIFERFESYEYRELSITKKENYLAKLEEISKLIPEASLEIIDELNSMIDNYIDKELILMYKIAFLDGYILKKELEDRNNIIKWFLYFIK